MSIGVYELIELGIQPTQAKAFAPFIDPIFERFGITTIERQAAWLAQTMHESARFVRLEENMRYTTTARVRLMWPDRFPTHSLAEPYLRNPQGLANRVYGGRFGNGDELSGDGWRYRARGLIGLTFKDNYRAAGVALGVDLVAQPELVSEPQYAALTSGHYWQTHRCNERIDAGDFDGTTRAINPGMAGRAERRVLYSTLRIELDQMRPSALPPSADTGANSP